MDTLIWNGFQIQGNTKELDFIAESEGHINLEKDDIISTLSAEGGNYVASGVASDLNGAFKLAVNNLNVNMKDVKRMLVQFVCGRQQADMGELRSVTDVLNEASPEISLIWGIASDSALGEDFKVIILLGE